MAAGPERGEEVQEMLMPKDVLLPHCCHFIVNIAPGTEQDSAGAPGQVGASPGATFDSALQTLLPSPGSLSGMETCRTWQWWLEMRTEHWKDGGRIYKIYIILFPLALSFAFSFGDELWELTQPVLELSSCCCLPFCCLVD